MFDIITFGSATEDNFLALRKDGYLILKSNSFLTSKALCFDLGSKIFIDDLKVFSGGGGTNTAATFARQGFKVAYVGKVGDDKAGGAIIEDLKRLKVATAFLQKDQTYKTALSIILSSPEGERTILIYRGACHFLQKEDIPWQKIQKAKWFYLAPLIGEAAELFGLLVNFAKENKIKIAANPGNTQLGLNEKILRPILGKIDILLLNKEEASLLTKIPQTQESKVINKLCSLCKGIIVVTKGKEGSIVSDGKDIFEAGIIEVPVVEKTGAGDAFGSGFVAGLLQKNNLKYAIQLATANSASCIQQIGAKNGLLGKKDLANLPRVEIKKSNLW